jgi:aryl-alcohol dehydrogenase-like predicted oxidoreductase
MKIHYVGLSNFTKWQLQFIISTAKAMGVQVPVTLQPQYSLLSREIEWEIIPAVLHNGMACCLAQRPFPAGTPHQAPIA